MSTALVARRLADQRIVPPGLRIFWIEKITQFRLRDLSRN